MGSDAPVRGCGIRIKGGVYAVCDVSIDGTGNPIEWFIVDPPVELPDTLGVTPIGVTLLEEGGIGHVVDWVGSRYYENVADFLEEARRFGLSRRLPRNLDFSKLSEHSKLILVHARGLVLNQSDYIRPLAEIGEEIRCPKAELDSRDIGLVSELDMETGSRRIFRASAHYDPHARPEDSLCAGIYWKDLTIGGEASESGAEPVYREMPSFSYEGTLRPEGVQALYCPAIFAMFPISRIVVIDNPKYPSVTEELRERIASQTWLQVDIEQN